MIEVLLIITTLLIKGFFSGSETAFISANKLRLEMAIRRKNAVANSIEFFISKPEAFLTTTLVGSALATVLLCALSVVFLWIPAENLLQNWFGTAPGIFQVMLFLIIITALLLMLFGELIPKAIFRAQADLLIGPVSIPLRMIYYLFLPFTYFVTGASNVLVKRLLNNPGAVETYYQRQDLELYLRELRENGGSEKYDEDDSTIIQNVIELSNKRVKESMIPRIEIEAVEKDTPIKEVLDMFISSGHSKLPVYKDSIDDVIGVVFAHDFFHYPKSLHEIIRPVKLVPSSKKSKDLLTEFRQSKMSVAIILDEYGGTAGMVTIEDLLEEVVGDIQDEYDVDDEIIKKLNDNTFVISGNVVIEDLVEEYEEVDLPLEPSQYDTVAGFIINHLGRIPKVNEEVIIEGKKFIISKATPSRIETVKLILNE